MTISQNFHNDFIISSPLHCLVSELKIWTGTSPRVHAWPDSRCIHQKSKIGTRALLHERKRINNYCFWSNQINNSEIEFKKCMQSMERLMVTKSLFKEKSDAHTLSWPPKMAEQFCKCRQIPLHIYMYFPHQKLGQYPPILHHFRYKCSFQFKLKFMMATRVGDHNFFFFFKRGNDCIYPLGQQIGRNCFILHHSKINVLFSVIQHGCPKWWDSVYGKMGRCLGI